jgi:hypothetical protein
MRGVLSAQWRIFNDLTQTEKVSVLRFHSNHFEIPLDANVVLTNLGYAYAFWVDAEGLARQESILIDHSIAAHIQSILGVPSGPVERLGILDDVQVELNPDLEG